MLKKDNNIFLFFLSAPVRMVSAHVLVSHVTRLVRSSDVTMDCVSAMRLFVTDSWNVQMAVMSGTVTVSDFLLKETKIIIKYSSSYPFF